MNYFDDILNVHAYLQSKQQTGPDLLRLQRQLNAEQEAYDRLSDHVDELLRKALYAARTAGIHADLSPQAQVQPEKQQAGACSEILISLPGSRHFSEDFARLREEAHAAGFVNVHPEELMTQEEILTATAFQRNLDQRFAAETGLSGKDLLIAQAVAAIRIFCQHLTTPSAEESATLPTSDNRRRLALIENDKESSIPKIKSMSRILSDSLPFDLQSNNLIRRTDALGFDPILGWFFGVVNIMTDTVTDKKLNSYKVDRPSGRKSASIPIQRISTPFQLLLPIFTKGLKNKEALAAAIIREGMVQGVIREGSNATSKHILQLLQTEEKHQKLLQKISTTADSFSGTLGSQFKNTVKQLSTNSFLNQLISLMHAILYNPETDGDLNTYAVRTSKVITLSAAFTVIGSSLPALMSMNLLKLDFTGLISFCLNLLHSQRFWIEVKTEYLVSAYKGEFERLSTELDQYFASTPCS